MSRDSSVSVITRLRAVRPGLDSQLWADILVFSTLSRPVLRLIQHPVLRVTGYFPQESCDLCVKLATHLHLKELRMYGAVPPLSLKCSWRAVSAREQFHLYSEVSVLGTKLSFRAAIQREFVVSKFNN
jgi:hypothetical protein